MIMKYVNGINDSLLNWLINEEQSEKFVYIWEKKFDSILQSEMLETQIHCSVYKPSFVIVLLKMAVYTPLFCEHNSIINISKNELIIFHISTWDFLICNLRGGIFECY